MKPYYQDSACTIFLGDCVTVLREMEANSVHCCVTSPPYWGLRDYGCSGQIGLEKTPEQYVAKLVAVFREVKRVLRDDATLWCNLGDSYNAAGRDGHGTRIGFKQGTNRASANGIDSNRPSVDSLKPKDLVGIPWRVAFALQADGWYLRSDCIWHKPNPMPESVTDRPTKSHEYIFLLSKNERYFYDAEAIKEPGTESSATRSAYGWNGKMIFDANGKERRSQPDPVSKMGERWCPSTRNRRTVWTVATHSYAGAHFATYPPDLIKPCILAGTSARGCCPECGAPWERIVNHTPMKIERSKRTHELGRTRSSGTMTSPAATNTIGWQPGCDCDNNEPIPCTVLDPFGGSGTTGQVAIEHGRKAILIELNPEYAQLANRRTNVTPGLTLA